MMTPQSSDLVYFTERIAEGKMVIRAEAFGCILFDLETGRTQYLAPENREEEAMILTLTGRTALPQLEILSAPEIVYWTSTYRCNYRCRGCYVLNEEERDHTELPTNQVKQIITDLGENHVFQFAIGGGEPFLRKDLFEIARFCRGKKIVPTVVTNGTKITEKVATACRVFGQINVSIDGTHEYYQKVRGVDGFTIADQAVRLLLSAGNRVGVNFVLSELNFENLDAFLSYAYHLTQLGDLREINVILFKPFGRGESIPETVLSKKHLTGLLARVRHIKVIDPRSPVRADEYCTNVYSPDRLHGTLQKFFSERNCAAGWMTLCIGVEGTISPCSYTQHLDHGLGNITEQPLRDIWFLNTLQRFRANHHHPICATCSAAKVCRGVCQFVPEGMIDCRFYRQSDKKE